LKDINNYMEINILKVPLIMHFWTKKY